MSLVTTASLWTNDSSTNKKRQPTIRKSATQVHSMFSSGDLEGDEQSSKTENYQNLQPSNIDDVLQANQDRSAKVTDLLNKITSANTVDDNSKLGTFTPPSPPEINVKKDMGDNSQTRQYVPPNVSFAQASIRAKATPGQDYSYGADDMKAAMFSNYNKSYEPPQQLAQKPYYANMGITSSGHSSDNKLMEKINYMIHLLEQQQHEKTNNITEEFILYTFLGVFIIFVADSFARSGKYTR